MCLLQTLGHLEKAVVLELTLKHVKALTSLLEQQQQKILALQNGMQIGELQITYAHTHMHSHAQTHKSALGTGWFLLSRMQIAVMNTQ